MIYDGKTPVRPVSELVEDDLMFFVLFVSQVNVVFYLHLNGPE